jgi:hypothetical protein
MAGLMVNLNCYVVFVRIFVKIDFVRIFVKIDFDNDIFLRCSYKDYMVVNVCYGF